MENFYDQIKYPKWIFVSSNDRQVNSLTGFLAIFLAIFQSVAVFEAGFWPWSFGCGRGTWQVGDGLTRKGGIGERLSGEEGFGEGELCVALKLTPPCVGLGSQFRLWWDFRCPYIRRPGFGEFGRHNGVRIRRLSEFIL